MRGGSMQWKGRREHGVLCWMADDWRRWDGGVFGADRRCEGHGRVRLHAPLRQLVGRSTGPLCASGRYGALEAEICDLHPPVLPHRASEALPVVLSPPRHQRIATPFTCLWPYTPSLLPSV